MAPQICYIQDGFCLVCKVKPPTEQTLICRTCASPWHASCLLSLPETLDSTLQWVCPDCAGDSAPASFVAGDAGGEVLTRIMKIQGDTLLSEDDKARKRQELMGGELKDDVKRKGTDNLEVNVLELLDKNLECSFCMQLYNKPVTAPCGHSFCLKCFKKWINQHRRDCIKCRKEIPYKMISHPHINSTLASAIHIATSKSNYNFVDNQDRPDKAYTRVRAQRGGNANASCKVKFVTVPSDHFGPIPAQNDPKRNTGVLVGESWETRLDCVHWGVHTHHLSQIVGQSGHGAQSIVLTNGYMNNEDHGEWFLYTEISSSKRKNKEEPSDQVFKNCNDALRVSCIKGYPVRVVRSHEENSSYAPSSGLRYDGIYRVEKCWRIVGNEGFPVCRYLFVRCDNEAAPWTRDGHGDRPRPLPFIKELETAVDITEREESPSWDFSEEVGQWKWIKPSPPSREQTGSSNCVHRKRPRKERKANLRERLLKEFSCSICSQVMSSPVTILCGHSFCKACLEGAFRGKAFLRDRNVGGRILRQQKIPMQCPDCLEEISESLKNLQVNREMKDVIESLQSMAQEATSSEQSPDLTTDTREYIDTV